MAAKKRRAPVAAGGAADQSNAIAGYSEARENAIKSKAFTRRKLEWLEQVASDSDLPPAASRVATLLATRYVNSTTGDAWPGIGRLARELNVSDGTVRGALKAMRAGHHLLSEITEGGAKNTNREMPILNASKPFKNLKGSEIKNPSNLDAITLQNSRKKPFKNLKGNLLEEPVEEPIEPSSAGGPSARPASSDALSTLKAGDETHRLSPDGEPRVSPDQSQIRIGDTLTAHDQWRGEIAVGCVVIEISIDEPYARVRLPDGSIREMLVDGEGPPTLTTPEDETTSNCGEDYLEEHIPF